MSSNNDKDRIGGDLCRHHAARGEKEVSRVCPSKLSKRELEDLYYSLLDNNLELKRAVNGQNEKIRLLTTKVNRMTAQNKTNLPKDQKDCCAGAKAIITDQKSSIADLKKANECMSERIKRLNTRLCSAKQFLKKSPSQTINKCCKCLSGVCTHKNPSTVALSNKGSDMNLKNRAHDLPERESPKTITVETNTIEWEHLIHNLKKEKSCDENKCRSTMDELKQKIVVLQEELSKSRKDHSQRMCQLEQQVARLQALSQKHSDNALRRHRAASLAEGEKEQLKMQLSTEKMKVAELEAKLKSANMSKEVATAIEKHLSHANKLQESREQRPSNKRCVCNICPRHSHANVPTANAQTEPRMPRMFNLPTTTYEDKQTTSDDSGYAEHKQDSQKNGVISKISEEVMNKISYLQEQLNIIKSALVATPPGPSSEIASKSTFESYETIKDFDVPVLKNVKDYNCIIVDPKSNAIIEIAHVNKTNADYEEKEMIDSDIEGLYNKEKVKNKESVMSVKGVGGSKSMATQLKEDRHDEKELTLYDVNSDLEYKRRKTSISFPENLKQEAAVNDTMKSPKGDENVQENDLEKKIKERDSIVEPPIRQFAETYTLKCNKYVICECPACEAEAAKSSETPLSRVQSQSRDIFHNKVNPSNSDEGIPLQSKTKPDTHNSLQIPGPLPTSDLDSYKNNNNKRIGKKTKDGSTTNIVGNPEKKKEEGEPIGKVNDEDVYSCATRRDLDATCSKIADKENVSTIGKNIPEKEKTAQSKPEATEKVAKLNDSDENIELPSCRRKSTVVSLGDEDTSVDKQMTVPDCIPQKDVNDAPVREKRTVKEEVKRINEKAIESVACCRGKENVLEMGLTICGRQPVCLCPDDTKFSTKPCGGLNVKPDAPKCCKCAAVTGFLDSESKPACLDEPRPSSAGGTYTLPSSEAKCSRATTPDNTECEISYMSDLPTEKEGTSRRSSMSPGEHKMTTTYQDSYTPCHWSSLSEGEVPNTTKSKRKLSISVGEHPGDEHSTLNPHFPEAAAEKMEAALRSISRELARCRAMLYQRPREPSKMSKDVETLTSELSREESFALRRSKANPSVGGTTPKCVFILHIGTIVLSDEAVINSRDAPLMLTWKFFDQTAAMTRMTPGRVIHFDFSTEYEVKMTEEFVEYMKHAEMPIKICEMDNKENLFAMCTLPLREALLNVNRRADLSLELVTHSTNRRAHDSLDTSDEVGVLDLWCMLRAESRNLAALQKACGLNSTITHISEPKTKLGQIADDVQSYDCVLSQDLELDLHNLSKHKIESKLDHNHTLLGERISRTPPKDFYVRESSEPQLPLANGAHLPRHHKLGAPSVTSNLGMCSFDSRPPMTNINAPSVDVTRQGCVLTEVTPKVPQIGEKSNEFERLQNHVYPSYDKFYEKEQEKRSGVGPGSNDKLDGSTPNIENWRSMVYTEPTTSMKEMKPSRELRSFESESLSRKKYRESGGAGMKASKDSQSLESETMSPKKLRHTSTQSMDGNKKVTIAPHYYGPKTNKTSIAKPNDRVIEITVIWLALNEECAGMRRAGVRRLYVAYSFLGRDGAELETPVSLPKPKYYVEKCFFNFKKTFHLTEFDMPVIAHMANCRSLNRKTHNSKDCIVFSVVSEPPEDPLGLENCEDIGYAYLYLGDLLAYSAGDTFTQVLPVSEASGAGVCGVLAVRFDGLGVLRAHAAC